MAWLMQCLYQAWRNSKNGGATVCCKQQLIFKRVLDIVRIKIQHLEGENKWESSGSLDSNELDIEGLKAAQRNELVVPGQKRMLIQMSALILGALEFLLWIKLESRLHIFNNCEFICYLL